MKKLVRGLMGGGIAVRGLGAWAGVASASGGTIHAPAQFLPAIFPAEGLTPDGALPPGGGGNFKITGNCPSYLFIGSGTNATDAVGFAFVDGNGHFYQVTVPGDPTSANGANVEGTATLVIGDNTNPGPTVEPYTGHTHLWFGTNSNANGQMMFAQTIAFHGVAPDGSSITIEANPGSTTAAHNNHSNGWGELTITCS